MRKHKGLFTWGLPETKGDSGEISCPRQYGGCGRRHSWTMDELLGELEFDSSWESSKGDFWCDEFADWLEEDARQEGAEEVREIYWDEVGEFEEQERQEQDKRNQEAKVKAGVRIDDRQYDKELGRYQQVGYWKGKSEFFICGNCDRKLPGAKRHGKAKNRNNPAFGGLEVAEKVLCLACVKKQAQQLTNERRKVLFKYVRRGYV